MPIDTISVAYWQIFGDSKYAMENIHGVTKNETKALPKDTIWIQPDLFEVAGIYEESCGGQIHDFSDLIKPSTYA